MNVCVDASLVLKWLVPEEGSEKALQLYRKWRKEDVGLIAPGLIEYEIGTTLRQKVVRGLLKSEDLFPVFEFYRKMDLLLFHLTDLVSQAVAAASALEQPTVYDASYLLIARQQKVDFITADERFYRASHPIFSFVKLYNTL